MFARKKEETANPGPTASVQASVPGKKPGEEGSTAAAGAAKPLNDVAGSKPFPRTSSRQGVAAHASVLNSHLSFEGTLKYSGSVTLDCEFRGSIVTEDTLVIGPSARVEAEIKAGVVEIAGKVRGNVQAKTRVKVRTGAEVYGDVETPTISMEDGVVFEGHCTRPHGSSAPSGSAPGTTASALIQQVLEKGAAFESSKNEAHQPVEAAVGSTSAP